MEPQVVYEDESFFVLNKPSGWIVNKAATTKGQPVIQEWLEKKDFPLAGDDEFRSGVVHRLDKETSGVILIAKKKSVFRNLQGQFKKRTVKKTYTALLHGKLEPVEGSVNAPIGRLPWNRKRFGILPEGRKAVTTYKVIDYYSKGDTKEIFSLTEFYPKTGRTHQIRVHAKYLKRPVVSDEFYAGRKTARGDRVWCPRLFLHASKIEFEHPVTHKKVTYKAQLPEDLKNALRKLSEVIRT